MKWAAPALACLVMWSGARLVAQSTARSFVVLVDASASVDALEYPKTLEVLERGLFARLRPADRVRVGAITDRVAITEWFTADQPALRAGARAVLNAPPEQRYGASPLWDAVDAAVAALESEPGPRGVILMSDGMASGNVKSLSAVVRRAVSARVAVSVIDVGVTVEIRSDGNLPLQLRPEGPLRALAEVTGGKYVQAAARAKGALVTFEAALTQVVE
jgi:hypothetical protein